MISIAMATYNGATFIGEQIESILNQTINDFELIICDDSSKDNTWTILEDFSKKDERISIYRNEHNLGFKKNFEKAMSLCKGDYIALCDQDDIWMPNHLEKLLNATDDNLQIVCGDSELIDENGNELGLTWSYLYAHDYNPTDSMDIARHIILNFSSYQGASMLIKKDFLKWGLPIPEKALYHDQWFAFVACFTGGLKYMNIPLLKYRRHSGEITKNQKRSGALRSFGGRILYNHWGKDGLVFVDEIRRRVFELNDGQRDLLDVFEKMLKRKQSFWGRIMNIPYFIKYFKPIFTFDGKHFF